MIALDLGRLAMHELWSYRARSLLSILALALASGLIVATGGIGALLRSAAEQPAPLTSQPADFWIASAYDADYDLPAALVERAGQVPGVAAVQPLLRRPAQISTGSGAVDTLALVGVDLPGYLAFHRLALAAGDLPTAQQPGLVALSPWALVRQVRPGDAVTLTLAGTELALPLSGLIEVRDLASAQPGPVIYAPREAVAALAGVDKAVTLVEVRLASGASARRVQSALETELGTAYVVSSPAQPHAGLWQRVVVGALAFVDVLVLIGSAALVYAAFASAAPGRARRVAVLRAVGAARAHVIALLIGEAALLGWIGGCLGLLLGSLLARVGSGLAAPGTTGTLAPPLPGASIALALVLVVGSSIAGALGPVLRAARQPPVVALHPGAPPGMGAIRTGCTSRLPGLARLAPATFWLLPGLLPLAVGNLARDPRRAHLVAGALALVLTMFLGSIGILSLLDEELAAAFGRLSGGPEYSSGGDYLLLPDVAALSLGELAGQDTSGLPPLSPSLLAALDARGDGAWIMRGTTASVPALEVFPGQPTILLDVGAYARMGAFRFRQGSWPEALAAFERGPAVLLVPAVARRLGAGPGDLVRLDTVRGPIDFTVAGVGDSEFTTCVLSLADGQAYLGANEVNAALVKLRPGTDPATVRSALRSAVRTHGGTLLSLREAAGRLQGTFQQARLAMGLLSGLSGLVALLGVVSATLSSVAERREEIGLLRAVGAARPHVARLVLAEAGLLGAVAAGVGTLLGWAVTLIFFWIARAQLGLGSQGLPGPGAWAPLLAATAAAWLLWPGLAMLAALVAARAAARLPILEALFGTP
ncbi:MAG: ABC transporter permease [Anaerolineae bacterium]|nr:ABC transporter permease [Anaerolineae bacterium]